MEREGLLIGVLSRENSSTHSQGVAAAEFKMEALVAFTEALGTLLGGSGEIRCNTTL